MSMPFTSFQVLQMISSVFKKLAYDLCVTCALSDLSDNFTIFIFTIILRVESAVFDYYTK